jgi:subtilisin family serine protease
VSSVLQANWFEAIRYAVDTWKVDIISMSFGFQRRVIEIRSAISYAYKEGVIMLAAASNGGGNSGIAWPAQLSEVICIHASDSKGNKANFTPDISLHADNFSVPGTYVRSCWPSHLNQGIHVLKSGTSCSTPIAAGIAALLLEIAGFYLSRQKDIAAEDELDWQSLRSVAGMRLAFRKMSRKRDKYDYIAPWRFLGDIWYEGHKLDIAMGILLQELRTKN